MNNALLQQLMLAKEAGSNAMAKDFFKKTTSLPDDAAAGGPMDKSQDDKAAAMGAGPSAADGAPEGHEGAMMEGSPAEEGGESKEQELMELLQLLEGGQG